MVEPFPVLWDTSFGVRVNVESYWEEQSSLLSVLGFVDEEGNENWKFTTLSFSPISELPAILGLIPTTAMECL